MKYAIGIFILLCVLAIATWLLLFGTPQSTTISLPAAAKPTDATVSPSQSDIAKSATSAASAEVRPSSATRPAAVSSSTEPPKIVALVLPAEPEFTNLPPATVLENMRLAFRNYISAYGSNPVGTNPEITQALNGGNRRQTHFLDEGDGLRINGRGELIDSWGTPYFFHQLSGTEMEIHSAGPDRVMWTSDDLVSK